MKRWAADEEERIRATFTNNPDDEKTIRGSANEMFIGVESQDQNWFGAEVSRVSTIDDYRNGIDFLMELPRDPELGIDPVCGFDVTCSEADEILTRKERKLGKGTKVDFFRSKLRRVNGKPLEGAVDNVPMVILGVNRSILSKVGAALRRGEKIGPDHPIKAVLLRQAEIQAGLQIRKLGADLMTEALNNMPRDPDTRRVVEEYAERFRADDAFYRNVPAIRDLLRQISGAGMTYYIGERNRTRLRHLLAVHAHFERQLETIDETRPDVRRMAGSVRLSQRNTEAQAQPALSKISPIGDIFLTRLRARPFPPASWPRPPGAVPAACARHSPRRERASRWLPRPRPTTLREVRSVCFSVRS
jgi:hypothetical protein